MKQTTSDPGVLSFDWTQVPGKPMEVHVLAEVGHDLAIQGMHFSHELEVPLGLIPEAPHNECCSPRGLLLSSADKGHNKFLESMFVYFDVRTSLKVWKQLDTYRIATKQSKSTMHTLTRRPLCMGDFNTPLPLGTLNRLNQLMKEGAFMQMYDELPSGYLQTKRCVMSYKTLRNLMAQRVSHKLPEWQTFITSLLRQLTYAEYLGNN